jgi:hypothetical protein
MAAGIQVAARVAAIFHFQREYAVPRRQMNSFSETEAEQAQI